LLDRITFTWKSQASARRTWRCRRPPKIQRRWPSAWRKHARRQQRRYADLGIRTNAEAEGELLDRVAAPEPAGAKLLAEAAAAMRLTARDYHRVLKVRAPSRSRPPAKPLARVHIAEALSYRRIGACAWYRHCGSTEERGDDADNL